MWRNKDSSKLRTLLILGRVSNLPTVWSNCLAGWWLGGGGTWLKLVWVCLATSMLYIGGMYLNDAFDAEYDRQRRRSRPIPSGEIEIEEVWLWGFAWLAVGVACLIGMGKATAFLAVCLAGSILLYDAIHKAIALAPVLMAACRVIVYLIAASVASGGVTGAAVWGGLALGAYVAGVSCLARKEGTRGPVRLWPVLFLAGPLFLAWLVNDGSYRMAGFLSLILTGWVLWALRPALWRAECNVGHTVSMLLAGIAMVDLLAVTELSRPGTWLFVLWFLLALVLQQRIPAT